MKEYIEKISHVSEQQFLALAFKRSSLGKRLSEQQQQELCRQAQTEGAKLAVQLRQDFAGKSPSEIAKKLGVEVTCKEYTIHETFTSLGYFEVPNQIVVNKKLKEKDSFFAEQGLPQMKFDYWKEIVVAHELFHFIQEQTPELFINQYRMELWKLGPYRHQSSLSVLGEIAGMSFAKGLMNLAFYPEIIEWYLLYPYFPEQMSRRVEQFL